MKNETGFAGLWANWHSQLAMRKQDKKGRDFGRMPKIAKLPGQNESPKCFIPKCTAILAVPK